METNGNDRLRKRIVLACIDHGFEPWEGRSNWVGVAEVLGEDSSEKLRSQYRRLRNELEDRGKSIYDYIADIDRSKFTLRKVDFEEEKKDAFEKFVESTGIDTDIYQVEVGSFWGSAPNLQFSAKFRRREIPKKEQVDRIIERLEDYIPDDFQEPQSLEGSYTAIASIYDLHLERAGVDGSDIYDAEKRFHNVIDYFGRHLARYKNELDEVVFVVGNDFSNFDNPEGTTTRGTPQENSVHWRIGIDRQTILVEEGIRYLLNYAPVRVIFVPDNHSRYSNYWLGKYTEAVFRNTQHVTVDNSKNEVKFHKSGDNAFMFLHGDNVGKKRLIPYFATKGSDIFSNSSYREIHTGHFHGRRETFDAISEEFGVMTRVHPSLSSTSDWEQMKAFTENNRAGILSMYHETDNLIADFYVKV